MDAVAEIRGESGADRRERAGRGSGRADGACHAWACDIGIHRTDSFGNARCTEPVCETLGQSSSAHYACRRASGARRATGRGAVRARTSRSTCC